MRSPCRRCSAPSSAFRVRSMAKPVPFPWSRSSRRSCSGSWCSGISCAASLLVRSGVSGSACMADVRITGLHKRFSGEVRAVRGIDLTIPDRQFTVLVGPSGCGKSTLLRTIAGLEEPDEGTIEIGGEVVNDVRPRDRDVAMVFQDYALYPHMTVRRNIGFGLKARKYAKAEIDKRVASAAELLGI